MQRLTSLALLVVLALALGCGGEAAPGPMGPPPEDAAAPPPEDAGAPPPPPPPGTTTLPAELAGLAGTYAMEQVGTVEQNVPFTGWTEGTTLSYALVTLAVAGDSMVATEAGCHVLNRSSAASATIPDAVPRSIDPIVTTLSFEGGPGAWTWYRPSTATAVGYRPGTPGDAVPTEPSDPRVFDQDGDGNPGVTVRVEGIVSGELHVAQLQRTRMSGQVGEGRLTGVQVDEGSVQNVLAATNPLLAMRVEQRPVADPAKNGVTLVRLEGDYDCDRLVSELGSLFP